MYMTWLHCMRRYMTSIFICARMCEWNYMRMHTTHKRVLYPNQRQESSTAETWQAGAVSVQIPVHNFACHTFVPYSSMQTSWRHLYDLPQTHALRIVVQTKVDEDYGCA